MERCLRCDREVFFDTDRGKYCTVAGGWVCDRSRRGEAAVHRVTARLPRSPSSVGQQARARLGEVLLGFGKAVAAYQAGRFTADLLFRAPSSSGALIEHVHQTFNPFELGHDDSAQAG